MLTGELPIGRFAPPSSKTPVDTRVDQVVFRTLEKDRERRFQSAGEMKTQVEHLTPGSGSCENETLSETSDAVWSRKAVGAVILTALSLPIPLLIIIAMATRTGGISAWELSLGAGALCLFGIPGVLLDWMGLSDIRNAHGRVRGVPFAVFGALFWPLLTLLAIAIPLPFYLLVQSPKNGFTFFQRLSSFIVPAGTLTFAIWAIYAASQYAANRRRPRKRGFLKYAFGALLLAGMALSHLTRFGATAVPQHAQGRMEPISDSAPAAPVAVDPIRADFRASKGQVITLQLLRRDGEKTVPIDSMSGYALCPDDERGRFSLILTPEPPSRPKTERKWRLSLATEDGATVVLSSAAFGELIPHLARNYVHLIEPESSSELMLTRGYPGAETNLPRRVSLSVALSSVARGTRGGPQHAVTVGGSSTNWLYDVRQAQFSQKTRRTRPGEVLASQWLKSTAPTNTTNFIRFTFTRVELRNEGSTQWMAMDYATQIRGNCEEVFRVDGKDILTRKTSLLLTPEDSPEILRQRFEWRVPATATQLTIAQLAEEFAKELVGKSFVIPEGEQRPLLNYPIGTIGNVSVGIGARLRD